MSGELVVLGAVTLPGVHRSVRNARRFLRDMLPPGHPGLDDLMTVGSETVCNAITHTASGDGGWVTVSLLAGEGVHRLEVADDGADGRRPRVKAEDGSESGRGMRVVEALSDRWGYRTDGDRTMCGRSSVPRTRPKTPTGGCRGALPRCWQQRSKEENNDRSRVQHRHVVPDRHRRAGGGAPLLRRHVRLELRGRRRRLRPGQLPGRRSAPCGISHEPDASRNHAMFLVLVEDVDAVCDQTVKTGGKVAMPPLTTGKGLKFAYLQDPSGNTFGVFTPPSS
ncbi:ATP-binding protein [Actinomadura luteofluorescens]|uniref:ATP-binding protein n=1 Tax=Actinomadura luteofluorescens TaxID=46163 RepID=UPI003628AB11